MKRSQLAVALYAVLTFAAGALVGVAGYRLYTSATADARGPRRAPEDYRKKYVDEMRSRLKLSEQQVSQLNLILDTTRDRFRQLRDKERPEMKAIQDEQTTRIRAMLDPAQQAEYEKMRQEREKHMEKSKGGPGRH
jgi:Spy/CpxP family protein refolding chaperone